VPRPPRIDFPGAWHHVGNRGLSQRSMFDVVAEARFFLSLLAREVRAGRIAILAYCILGNHFHVLLVSLRGELPAVMRDVMSRYVKWFNARLPRDGPLCRGRYWSRLLTSETYRRIVLGYVHDNAVAAGIAAKPEQHAFSSAFHYASARRPPWLSTTWADGWLPDDSPRPEQDAADDRELVELRLRQRPQARDPLDDLLGATPTAVRAWLESRAVAADGTASRIALVAPGKIRRVVSAAKRGGEWALSDRLARGMAAWDVCLPGLLRDLAALSQREIAALLGDPETTVRRRVGLHERALVEQVGYMERVSELASACLARRQAA
jgi:hypothetical protein